MGSHASLVLGASEDKLRRRRSVRLLLVFLHLLIGRQGMGRSGTDEVANVSEKIMDANVPVEVTIGRGLWDRQFGMHVVDSMRY
jgi:hypothetical protein